MEMALLKDVNDIWTDLDARNIYYVGYVGYMVIFELNIASYAVI